MKKATLFILFVSLLLTSISFAQNYKVKKDHPDYAKIEANLLEGLSSDVQGLKFTSAFALGEMKSEKAVNPLIEMLRSHKDENYRILAALSLSKIGTERALYMVKRVGEFIDNPKVSGFCDKFLAIKKEKLPEKDEKLVTKLLK